MMQPTNQNSDQGVTFGSLLVITINLVIEMIFILFGTYNIPEEIYYANPLLVLQTTGPILLFFIGVLQWLYIVPLIIMLSLKQKKGLIKGIIMGALVTMLLGFVACVLSLF